mgnify:CR=1 FL=1
MTRSANSWQLAGNILKEALPVADEAVSEPSRSSE